MGARLRERGGVVSRTVVTRVCDNEATIDVEGVAPDDALRMATEQVRVLTGADAAMVQMVSSHLPELSLLCLSTGRAVVCRDTERDARVDRVACRQAGVRSVAVAPLRHDSRVLGVLTVVSGTAGAFDPLTPKTLEALAELVAAQVHLARRVEQQATEIGELTGLNAALDDFGGHVAHDLRNPIAVVTMAVAALRKVLGDGVAEAASLLEAIEGEALRSNELIDGLLGLARAKRAPRREAFDLGRVVEEAARGVAGITLENHCAGRTVVADWVAVRQAVTNLLWNASRHGRGPDATCVVTVRCERTLDGWRVLVADRGPGLPAGDANRVFAAFERAVGARPVAGSGLGLSIVSTIAAAHGGRAGYEPRPGGGAVFWFSLRK